MYTRKRIVIALGGNALGDSLPEQMTAVKSTSKAICDLIEDGHEVVIVHGNGPQVGMINNAMSALSREDENQPNTPLSVCVAMSQGYIGYDLQNAIREELRKRGFLRTPVVTIITQVRVDEKDPAFDNPSKPIGRFLSKEDADFQAKEYGHIMKEDAGRGYPKTERNRRAWGYPQSGGLRTCRDNLRRRRNSCDFKRRPFIRRQRGHRQRLCQRSAGERTGRGCADHPDSRGGSSHQFRQRK